MALLTAQSSLQRLTRIGIILNPLTKTSFPSPRPNGHPSPAGEGQGVRASKVAYRNRIWYQIPIFREVGEILVISHVVFI
jgi:hypothetical protein